MRVRGVVVRRSQFFCAGYQVRIVVRAPTRQLEWRIAAEYREVRIPARRDLPNLTRPILSTPCQIPASIHMLNAKNDEREAEMVARQARPER